MSKALFKKLEWYEVGELIPGVAIFMQELRWRTTDEVIDSTPMGKDYKQVQEALYEVPVYD